MRSHAELLFEEYLQTLRVPFAYEPAVPSRRKRLDYEVTIGEQRCWFEVKELLEPETIPTRGFDPTPPFEEKINEVRKQFKEFKQDSCVLVLHGCKSIYRRPMTPEIVSAAFGERILLAPESGQTLCDEPLRFRFRGKAMLRPNANTSISAIVILEHYQVEWRWEEAFYQIREKLAKGEPVGPLAYAEEFELMEDSKKRVDFPGAVRAVILENPYARVPLPPSLLGPLDQRWGIDPPSGWYTLISLGEELSKLRQRQRPFPFLAL
jgi:hypothetical protein